MKVAICTLGCKVNQYETQALEQELLHRGHTLADFEETADAYVVNTCSVTAVSDKKSRQMLRQAQRRNPSAVIAACGCYAQTHPEDVKKLGLDVIAECVNPLPITRDAWRAAASRRGARIVEVELVCSDAAEHRARLQARTPDIDGLRNPSWRQVVERHYEPWGRDRLVIDTSAVGPDEAVRMIRQSFTRSAS